MTATATRAPERAATGEASALAGLGAMVRFMLRRDRIKFPAWTLGLALFVVYIGSALPVIAPTEQELTASVPMLQQPIGRMFTGPAYGLDAITYERFFSAGYVAYLYIVAALMTIFLVTRHTRTEEQTGRAELIRANVVGRHTPLTAALVVALITSLVAGLLVTATAVSQGFAVTGSVLVGLGVVFVALCFAGITAVTVQLTEYSRAAAGLAGAILGLAFIIRALGDMAAIGGSALSWASPLGWATQTAPFVLDRWWPLALVAALAVAAVVVAYLLQARRDLGAGLVAARQGRPEAGRWLAGPWGLAARLQRSAILAWGGGIVALGVVDGLFTQTMLDVGDTLPEALGQVFGAEALATGYLAFLAVFSGYMTAAYVVYSVQALRAEERSGRGEAVLATPTSRIAWAGAHLGVVALGASAIMLVTGLLTGTAAAAVTGTWSFVADSVLAHANLLPAVLVVLGLCALVFGWLPRFLGIIGWTMVGVMFFVGNFAPMMDAPQWLIDLSPLSHPANYPVEEFAIVPVLVLAGIALAGVLVGLVGLTRREVLQRG